MNKIAKYMLIALGAMMVSCDDNDINIFSSPGVDDPTLSGSQGATTVSALTFGWQAVDGVNQYGYQLADPDGTVVREGVTSENTVTFTKLTASTTYTLTVEAFGANGVNTRRFTMTGTTGDIISLSAPTGFEMTQSRGKITISWPAVEHASLYTYTVVDAEGETVTDGTVSDPQVTLSGLAIGEYTLTVYATSDDETYSQSGTATYVFERNREVILTKQGTYESYYLGTWPCTLDICDDGSYIIHDFMQVEGYDLEFSIGDDNGVNFLNYYDENGSYRYMATGLETDYYIAFYQSIDYAYYTNTAEEGSAVTMLAYYATDDVGGYDVFRWDVPEPVQDENILYSWTATIVTMDYPGNQIYSGTRTLNLLKDGRYQLVGMFEAPSKLDNLYFTVSDDEVTSLEFDGEVDTSYGATMPFWYYNYCAETNYDDSLGLYFYTTNCGYYPAESLGESNCVSIAAYSYDATDYYIADYNYFYIYWEEVELPESDIVRTWTVDLLTQDYYGSTWYSGKRTMNLLKDGRYQLVGMFEAASKLDNLYFTIADDEVTSLEFDGEVDTTYGASMPFWYYNYCAETDYDDAGLYFYPSNCAYYSAESLGGDQDVVSIAAYSYDETTYYMADYNYFYIYFAR